MNEQPERRKNQPLSEDQINEIADRAAERALEKVYTHIGKSEKLSNREKFLAATGIMACWTVLAITGHTPMEPLITMYQMILGGLGVGGAMAWKAK